MEAVHALQPALILLSAGLCAMLLMPRVGLSPVVGYLVAGMLIGDHGLHLIPHNDSAHLLAELGVVFLLFDIGLHFSMRHIWEARRDILGLGPIQMLASTVALALLLFYWADITPYTALLIGAALALSSTAVASQTLVDFGQQRAPVGISTTAVLVFQDICAIFLLVLATSLGADDGNLVLGISAAILKSILAFVAAIVLGQYVVNPVFNFLGKHHREGTFTTFALLLVLAAAATTGALGLSLTLGAFLAGMIISTTAYKHVVRTEIQPFRGLLLGFFFINVGMALDAASVLNNIAEIAVAVLLLMVLKGLLAYSAARMMKQPFAFSVQLGALLSQGSEFAFVILALPAVTGLIPADEAAVIITAVAISMALTTPFSQLTQWLAKRWADKAWNERAGECVGVTTAGNNVDKGNAAVIILGMNKAGRLLADVLDEQEIAYKAFDYNHDRFVKARIDGYPVAFGDLADLRLMETLEMADAKVLAVCEPRPELAREVGPALDARYPLLKRYLAVPSSDHASAHPTPNSIPIVCHSLPQGIDLSGAVLKALDVNETLITQWFERKLKQELTELSVREPHTSPDTAPDTKHTDT